MAICKRSVISRALLLAGLVLAGTPAWSGEPQDARTDARTRTQQQGDAAMERLKGAIGKIKNNSIPSPILPDKRDGAIERRAFEGLGSRKTDPALLKRTEADMAAARERLATEREEVSRRIAQALGLEQPEELALAGTLPPSNSKAWVPVLFASSSMPIATLRTYAAQLEAARGVLAFRGMPGGMMKVGPMAKLSASILRLDPGCEGPGCAMRNVQLIVDPLVFRQHGVMEVPALAMVPGDPTQPYCERDEASPRGAHLVLGDAALTGLLEEYGRLGGKEEVRDVLARLERR